MENNIVGYVPKKSMSFLDHNTLCLYDPTTGFLKGNDINVKLRLSKKQIYGIDGGYFDKQNKWVTKLEYKITAEGYDHINRFLGLQVVAPTRFKMNGVEYSNPTVRRDENGCKDLVMYTCAIAGRDPSGKIHITSPIMVSFSQEESMITSLTNKLKKDSANKNASYNSKNPIGFLCPARVREKKLAENDFYEYFPITKSRGIIVDVSHPEFIKIEANMASKRENIERTIVTVTKRNAMRRHPAIGAYSLIAHSVKDPETNEIDMIATLKVKQWVSATDAELEEAIKNFNFDDVAETSYEDVAEYDAELDNEGEIIVDDNNIVTAVEQVVETDLDEDVNEAEDKELKGLKTWIRANWEKAGGSKNLDQLGVNKDSTIMELKVAKDYMERKIDEMEMAEGEGE